MNEVVITIYTYKLLGVIWTFFKLLCFEIWKICQENPHPVFFTETYKEHVIKSFLENACKEHCTDCNYYSVASKIIFSVNKISFKQI